MTAVWLTAAYTTTALLVAVRLGRRLRKGDTVNTPEPTPIHDAMKARDVRKAAFERIGEYGLEDELEWIRELLTSDDDWDAIGTVVAHIAMSAMPAPEFTGEDHL